MYIKLKLSILFFAFFSNLVLANEKIIYLTFDDGPVDGTQSVLEVIKNEEVPATMFFVGKFIEKNRQLYEESLSSSFLTIGNHTYSHANGKYQKFYSNSNIVINDMKRNQQLISENDKSFSPLRLAGRNVFRLNNIKKDDYSISKEERQKERFIYNKLAKDGFNIYGWDVEWNYLAQNKSIETPLEVVNKIEAIYKRKKLAAKDKVILLMHDWMFTKHFDGKKNLQSLIEMLKRKGWKFSHLKEYR